MHSTMDHNRSSVAFTGTVSGAMEETLMFVEHVERSAT